MNKQMKEIIGWITIALFIVSYLLVAVSIVWTAGREGFMYGLGAIGIMLFVLSAFLSLILKEL